MDWRGESPSLFQTIKARAEKETHNQYRTIKSSLANSRTSWAESSG